MADAFDVLVEWLGRPDAWDGEIPEIRTTHASVVVLLRDRVYKLKRPVDWGFLDYSTLDRRLRACSDEVRLNTPRAPGVYRGVVPIVADGDGFRVGGEGTAIEWAVEMARLPDDACLLHRLERGEATASDLVASGATLAGHHRTARRGPEVARHATLDVIGRHALDNLDQSTPEVGVTIDSRVHRRLGELVVRELDRLGPLVERRAASGIPCDTHGDLRLDHVYLLPQGIVFVDCIEFSEAYRYADPVSDLAFLTMDLAVRGEGALATAAADAWFGASGDVGGRALLPFYEAYRSAVRGKVAGLVLRGAPADSGALRRARRHWLFALGRLEDPKRRPCLVGIGGLPGTGKTTLATSIAESVGVAVVRSDVVRKEHAGPVAYSEAAKDAIYAECLDRAEALLLQGRQVIVDACFGRRRWRHALIDRARALGVPSVLLRCEADVARVLERLAARSGDASDADRAVYERAVPEWEPDDMEPIDTNDRTRARTEALEAIARRLSRY